MNRVQFVPIFIALLACSAAGNGPFDIESASGNTCSSLAVLKIKALGIGRCFGKAEANCEAHASAIGQIDVSISGFAASGPTCAISETGIQTAGASIGAAIAESFVQALAKVRCTGKGFACGFAVSNGDAWGQAYALAIVKAVAKATTGSSEAYCEAQVTGLANAIASVVNYAQAQACVHGFASSAKAFSESWVKSFICVFTRAVAEATAVACGGADCSATIYGEVDVTCGGGSASGSQETDIFEGPGDIPSEATADADSGSSLSVNKVKPCPDVRCCFGNISCPQYTELPGVLGGKKILRDSSANESCECPF